MWTYVKVVRRMLTWRSVCFGPFCYHLERYAMGGRAHLNVTAIDRGSEHLTKFELRKLHRILSVLLLQATRSSDLSRYRTCVAGSTLSHSSKTAITATFVESDPHRALVLCQ
jgi:hypothetical protein